ncbi:signal transduction histidine kinase [Stella humosa]|uniref:histidine kinase n=1 Tax=Stella humosa TaxID=94 RepID=A0A3N1MFD0_9PROT|nr:ATP-binding protein [Stella humosa]ROP99905.1 signal transduction histidine kinase [Stella humosa]
MSEGRIRLLSMGVFLAALCGWVGFGIVHDRADTEAAAFRHGTNLADALARQAGQAIAVTDHSLSALIAAIPVAGIPAAENRNIIFDLLSERQKAGVGSLDYFIMDGQGQLLHSARSRQPRGEDLSQRDWFAALERDRNPGLAIGKPVRIATGEGRREWAIIVHRAVRDGDGRLLAVFAAALSIDYLGHFYGALDIGPVGRVSLFRDDGVVLTLHPFREAALGASRATLPLFVEYLPRGPSGRFVVDNPIDGERRLVAYRAVDGYPLVVAVGMDAAWVLRPWLARSLRLLVTLGLLVALVVVLALYARKLAARRAAAGLEETRKLNLLARASLDLARTRSAETMLRSAAALTRSLVGAHQSVVVASPLDGGPPVVHAVSLSDRYAQWRGYEEAPTGAGIYRLVVESNKPMRLTQAELEAHPAWRGFGEASDRHPPMRGWLAVPLVGQDGSNIGVIQLSDRDQGDFSEADEAICQQFALMLSTLIENLRSSEALGQALDAERLARAELEATRAAAERARLRSETILDSISDAFYVLDREFRFQYLNDRAIAVMGKDLVGRVVWDAFPAADSVIRPALERAMSSGQAEVFTVHYGPLQAWFDARVYPFEDGLSVYFHDVTEKLDTEARLLQAQKMEAVGQLTGGIAHDFNNLLTVILGMGDAILAAPSADPGLREKIETIIAAGERGAQLTASLLAFSRRHPLDPRATDIGQLLGRTEGLLSRTLGQGIETEVVTSGSLWRAMVDAGQLELALLNLAINARDAMPEGGRLTIEAANARLDETYATVHPEVSAGQYVMIAVSDTGTGMSEAVVARAFEPFFTTKPVGKGSGLGLSMVYGFVKQSGGQVKIYSEPGEGTAVKLYLPRAIERTAGVRADEEPIARPPGGNESILVVEDSGEVCRLFANSLRALGYGVTVASDAEAALRQMAGARFDLLLTDVVLPGAMNGRELADEIRRRQPGLPVLYTSGYTENAIVHHGRLDPGVRLLRKPFRHADLARMVRIALADGAGGK